MNVLQGCEVETVSNHFGPADSPASYASFKPFMINHPRYFHPRYLITDYDNQTDVEQCWLGDDMLALADVDTENPRVFKTYIHWIETLVKRYKIDGLRIDTDKHVRKDFWPALAAASGVCTIGEALRCTMESRDTAYTADYTCPCLSLSITTQFASNPFVDVLDGVMDYPTWYQVVPAFRRQPETSVPSLRSSSKLNVPTRLGCLELGRSPRIRTSQGLLHRLATPR